MAGFYRPKGVEPGSHIFINSYVCEDCGDEWTDEWSAGCDDECACGATLTPLSSIDHPDCDCSACVEAQHLRITSNPKGRPMTILTVSDHASGLTKTYHNDAAGWDAAFDDFATPEDRARLATQLDEGVVYESWSGKSTGAIERERDPLGYWTRLCALIETDNQVWTVQ